MSKEQQTVLQCGYMRKQGKEVMSLWKKRYFKLCSNSTLQYYHNKTDSQTRGVIDLSLVTNMHKKKGTQFIIDTANRQWKFKLNNVSERDAWFQQIFAVCIKHRNRGDNRKQQIVAASCTTNFRFHTVAVGESLTDICSKYRISVHQIKQCNKDVMFGTRLHRLSGKMIVIPPKTLQTNSDHKNNNDLDEEYSELSADHFLKLLNTADPDTYLYFIYRKLQKLAKERDDNIVDKMLEQVILKLELYIQKKCFNIEHLLIHNHKIIPKILKICKMEDAAKTENKILTYSYQDWMKWSNKQKHNQEIHIRDFVAPKYDEIHSMKNKLWSSIRHCIKMKTKEINEKEAIITEWVKAINDNMKDVDDIQNNVDIEFPQNYNIKYFYIHHYYKEILEIVMDKLNTTNIKPHDAICIISWIEQLKLKLKTLKNKYEMTNEHIIHNLSFKQRFLMKLYINSAKEKWSLWLPKIVENECKKQECFIINDVPRVHCVQDVFTAFNHQFDDVMDKYILNGDLLIDIIMLILNTLDEFEILLKHYIESHHTEFEDEYLCGLI